MSADSRDWYRDWWRRKTNYIERASFRVSEGERIHLVERSQRRRSWGRLLLGGVSVFGVAYLVGVVLRAL